MNASLSTLKKDGQTLLWHGLALIPLVKAHGSPLRLTHLPSIGQRIHQARSWFKAAMQQNDHGGKYHYTYCLKASSLRCIVDEVLMHDCHLEASGSVDMAMIQQLIDQQQLPTDRMIMCNGYKTHDYLHAMMAMHQSGQVKVLPILDSQSEFHRLASGTQQNKEAMTLGLRIATMHDQTSRHGIAPDQVQSFVSDEVIPATWAKLVMVHAFMEGGMDGSEAYLRTLKGVIDCYVALKPICPDLNLLNLGGSLPIQDDLAPGRNQSGIIRGIVDLLTTTCREQSVDVPDLVTEFGSYTVSESGAYLFQVLDEKTQAKGPAWYQIDSSIITTLPDTWAKKKVFPCEAINHLDGERQMAQIVGLTCDKDDYYPEQNLPLLPVGEALYVGMFHTGAYQEGLSGYGGMKHCMIPAAKHLVIDGHSQVRVYAQPQPPEQMLQLLEGDSGHAEP